MVKFKFSSTTFWLVIILLIAAVLRLYKLGHVPLGLFGDEIDAGYNAFSFLHTGRDYNGNFFPIHFESMGDYRPFLFIWSLVPAISAFGLSEFSVRLTPAIFGILGVYFIYLLAKQFSQNTKTSPNFSITQLPLISALLLTITPWHIHYSRAAFEVTLMTSLLIFGVYAVIKSQTNPKWLIAAAFCFGINAYSYNVAKLYSPLLFLVSLFIYRKAIFKYPKQLLFTSLFLFLILLTPLIYDSTFGKGQNRFNSISILNQSQLVEKINYSRGQIPSYPEPIRKLFDNKLVSLSSIAVQQYFQSLSPEFLFSTGDLQNPRHSLPGFGLLYFWLVPLTLFGLYYSWQNRHHSFIQLILAWFFTAPLPSSITLDGGHHATRLFVMLPPLIIITSLGIYYSYTLLEKYQFYLHIAYLTLIIVSLAFYLQNYYSHYSLTNYRWWNYGFQPAIQFARQHASQYDTIIVTRSHSHLPMLYYVFYTQYDPAKLQQQFKSNNPAPTEQIGKYKFMTINPGDAYMPPKSLYIASPSDVSANWHQIGSLPSPDPQETTPVFIYLESTP